MDVDTVRMMAHISSALCGFLFFLIFILIEQVALLDAPVDEDDLDFEYEGPIHQHDSHYADDEPEEMYDHETQGHLYRDLAEDDGDDYPEQPLIPVNPDYEFERVSAESRADEKKSEAHKESSPQPPASSLLTVQEGDTKEGIFRWRIVTNVNSHSNH